MRVFFDAPAIHKLPDVGVLARRRTEKLVVIDFSKTLDVAHVKEDWNKRGVERMPAHFIPGKAADKLLSQSAGLALVPIKHVFICLEHREALQKVDCWYLNQLLYVVCPVIGFCEEDYSKIILLDG